jgi:hypothetical protein
VTAGGARYSFGGNVTAPRRILKGGYLSWHDPVSDHWWQQVWFDSPRPRFRDLGVFKAEDPRSLREIVDSMTPEMHGRLSRATPAPSAIPAAYGAGRRAVRIREQISRLG